MIRIIVGVTFLAIYLLLSYLVYPFLGIMEKKDKKKKDFFCLRTVQWGFRQILKIAGTKVTVIGKENIPDEPALFIGNHRSYFDILLTSVQYDGLMGFISKDAVKKFPSLNIWMEHIYCLFLNREDPRQGLQVILKAIEYVKSGVSIFIFPEGTRNKGEETSLLPFKEGSFKIATKSGCPIVPVSINNSAAIFENQFPRLKKAHVIIEYGKPIYPNELSRDELKGIGAKCQNIIQETLNKNAKLV